MPTDFQPVDVDYTAMPVGKAVRAPRGRIVVCPKCKRHGLELLYSQSRGRYSASYWHVAVRTFPGAVPCLSDGCRVDAATRSEFDKARHAD